LVAEISGNHLGSLDRAIELIRAAKMSGADAVKVQTYTPESLTIDTSAPLFVVPEGMSWSGRTLFDLYQEAATPHEWLEPLFDAAREEEITCFSTPFDRRAVDLLASLDAPAHKISSFEVTDLDLIRYVASTEKPLIISTGMASISEIDDALLAASEGGASGVVLLHCNSSYPAPVEEMNLANIEDMRSRFDVPIGLSDHSLGDHVAIAATVLGACVIEKHLTMDRTEGGPDAVFSMEPNEFADMARSVRLAYRSIGVPQYGPKPSEERSAVFRRSLFVVEDIAAGEEFTELNIKAIRPGYGMPPKHLPDFLGRRAALSLDRGTPLSWDLIEGGL
jgi:N-acetylneuraminate synthase